MGEFDFESLDDIYAEQAQQAKGGPRLVEYGVITSLSPLRANCSGSAEAVTAMIGYAPALGDLAIMLRGPGVTTVIGKIAVDQAAPVAIDPVITGSDMFPAAQSFSWKDGQAFGYQSAVRQGAQDSSGRWSGAWFYQGAPGALLTGATVTGCAVRVSRATGGTPGSQPISLYQSSTGTWPLADLSIPPTTVGSAINRNLSVGEEQWITLPNALGQALVDGDAGLMISATSPMVILQGVDTDPQSGLLRIDWTR